MKVTDLPKTTISDEGLSVRPMVCEVDVLSRPDGSASFSQGDSSVLAAVYGPAEVKINKELIDRATVDVIYKPKIGLPGCADKFLERLVRNTCETVVIAMLHPRSLISIVIQEIHNVGSFLACSINAVCLCLLDACVPMYFSVAAVSCMIDREGKLMLDPTKKQEEDARSQFTFVFDSKDKKIITSATSGQFSFEEYQQALRLCQEASARVFDFYKETMKKKLSKAVK